MARPRKAPEAQTSGEVLKILGKRVFGRKDCMPGVLLRIEGNITPEQAQWAIANGLAVWAGDAKGELEAADRRRMGAQKVAAESTMQRFDMMDPADREAAREIAAEEGDDVA